MNSRFRGDRARQTTTGLVCFLLAVVLAGAACGSSDKSSEGTSGATASGTGVPTELTISNPFNFRDHTGPNEADLPSGDLQQVGAFVHPSGSGTTVTAKQGDTVLTLEFTGKTIFPDLYEAVFPFDPELTGAWTISATRGAKTTSLDTSPISKPQLLPLVENLRIVGKGLTPTLTWEWPELSAFNGDLKNGIRVIDADTHDQIYTDWGKSVEVGVEGAIAEVAIPEGVLEVGKSYFFRNGVYALNPDGSTMNRSVTFVQGAYTPGESN